MGYIKDIRALIGNRPLILNGVKVLIVNDENNILLIKRPDGVWDIPGGLMELGEALEDTALREIKEETGLILNTLKLLGVFSGEKYFVQLPNGDKFYAVTTVFIAKSYTGDFNPDGKEAIELSFFNPNMLPHNINSKMMHILHEFINNNTHL